MDPIQAAAKAVIAKFGGLRIASRALLLDAGQLSRLANGKQSTDDPQVLRKLGLKVQIVPIEEQRAPQG